MKKQVTLFAAIAMLVLSAASASAMAGSGTEDAPFIITNQDELEIVTDFPTKHFSLANDIELDGVWTPICKETSSGYFEGVFDGNGHTISGLVTDGSEGGLFKHNKGTIKNLNIVLSADGFAGSGAVAHNNTGTISNCAVEGNISANFSYVGGICSDNSKNITQCAFKGNIENTGVYAGGISGYSSSSITESYFIGSLAAAYRCGGITGALSYSYTYGKYGSTYYNGTITDAKWDFESVWGMEESINDGYPYLRWEHSNVTELGDYTVSEIKIKSADGTELEAIPEGDFLAEICVTKNSDRTQADSLIIAAYDENDALVDIKLMSGVYYKNQTVNFSAMISADKKIGKVKGFVWDSLKGMVPLSNEEEV